MEAFRDLKKAAQKNLRGFWGQVVVLSLLLWIPTLLTGLTEQLVRWLGKMPAFFEGVFASANPTIPSMVTAIGFSLLCLLLWSPLAIGEIRWYWQLNNGEIKKNQDFFYYFQTYPDYLKAFGMVVIISLKLIGWFILLCSPAIITGGILFSYKFRFGVPIDLGILRPLIPILFLLWIALATILLSIIGKRYFLAPYFLAENPKSTVHCLVRRSVKLMKGYKGRVFLLEISFLIYYLPTIVAIICIITTFFWIAAGCLLLQIILNFFVKPWRYATMTRCANEIVFGTYEETQNDTREYYTSPT